MITVGASYCQSGLFSHILWSCSLHISSTVPPRPLQRPSPRGGFPLCSKTKHPQLSAALGAPLPQSSAVLSSLCAVSTPLPWHHGAGARKASPGRQLGLNPGSSVMTGH